MKRLVTTLAALTLITFVAAPGSAITLTGNESDFPPTALVEDDGGDTQLFDCGFGPNDGALDIGRVYALIENDNLYIGLQYQRFCFCDIQIGIALQTGPGGTATDPFNRQILWGTSGGPLPDYVAYDVIPTNCNGFNYEVIYKSDNAGGWINLGDGSNRWNFYDADGFGPGFGFKEFCFPLTELGIECMTILQFEAWITQDDFGNGQKPAFDFIFSDLYPSQQKSQFGGPTFFDVPDGDESKPGEMSRNMLYECPVPVESSTWGNIKSLYR